jgi:alkylation response protein AidB-like acyl-CoA dehydrogenase
MHKDVYEREHDEFRSMARTFFEKECAPHAAEWEAAGITDREVWAKAGAQGLLGFEVPEEFGGLGVKDFRYNAIINEEMIATGSAGLGFALQNDIAIPYLLSFGTHEQKARWLPGMVAGTTIAALALSEPGTGSDLRGIQTMAKREGDEFVLNGSKTFISNGILSDLVIVGVRTDGGGERGLSLLVIERGMPGFERGRKLDKIGYRSHDTAELSFNDVRVPVANLLGEEGKAMTYLRHNLALERLSIAVTGAAVIKRAYELTAEYCRERHAFGQAIGTFQANRFTLADLHTTNEVAQGYVNGCIADLNAGDLTPDQAAAAKYWVTERQFEVVDACLQLHGGYGYMNEYEIARLWRDSRIQRIYGGTNEIMKEIIGRGLGF